MTAVLTMHVQIIFSLCFLSSIFAYPHDYYQQDTMFGEMQDDKFALYQPSGQGESLRLKRQFNMQGGGGPGQGIDLSMNTRIPVWQSPNGRHSFDATGQYSQHLGGRWGNGPPNWGAGGIYTYRF